MNEEWKDQLSLLERGKEDYAIDQIIKDPEDIIKRRIHVGFIKQQILKYCPEGGLVWDPFSGSGSTALAALYANCKAIVTDLGELETNLANMRIKNLPLDKSGIIIEQADMLKSIAKEVDFVFAAPPIFDLSSTYSKLVPAEGRGEKTDVIEYSSWLDKVAVKIAETMKLNAYCCVYTCDIRKDKYLVPGSYYMMEAFLRHLRLVDICIIDLRNDSRRKRRCIDGQENSRKRHSIQHDYMYVFQKL